MGIDFRGSNIVRRVRIGKRTVKDGEAVAIWNRYGQHRQVVGPALCRLYYSTIRFLNRHVAQDSEYLRIRHRDGTIEHIRGPTVLFENPVYHLGVTVEKAIKLPGVAAHAVVMLDGMKTKSGSGAPSREIKTGPLVYFPDAQEDVQVFKWKDEGGGALSACRRVVHIGKTMTRELKCQVQGADNHSACVTVALRLRLLGIEEALAIQDPIGEGDSATEALVLAAVQGIRFSSLSGSMLEQARAAIAKDKFSHDLATELKRRAACELISVTVSAVEGSAQLNKILSQEDEIAAARVRDQVADAALAAAGARQEREQALEIAKQAHEIKLSAELHQAGLAQHDLEARRHLDHLKELRTMGVDLTDYLVHGPRSHLAAASAAAAASSSAPAAKPKPMSFLCL